MLLRVEPPAAAEPTAADERIVGRVLGAVVEWQRGGRWCWAAVAAGVAAYYGAECTQEDVARALGHGGGPSIDPSDGTGGARLDEALTVVDCFSHWSPGRPAWDRLVSELVAGRPVGVQDPLERRRFALRPALRGLGRTRPRGRSRYGGGRPALSGLPPGVSRRRRLGRHLLDPPARAVRPMTGAWERALAGWRAAVGPDHVHTSGPVWQRFNAGTYPGGWDSRAVVRPANVREAARCVRVTDRP